MCEWSFSGPGGALVELSSVGDVVSDINPFQKVRKRAKLDLSPIVQ
jgi:hypothetical protein